MKTLSLILILLLLFPMAFLGCAKNNPVKSSNTATIDTYTLSQRDEVIQEIQNWREADKAEKTANPTFVFEIRTRRIAEFLKEKFLEEHGINSMVIENNEQVFLICDSKERPVFRRK